MTIQDLIEVCPAVVATQPHARASARYEFIPTLPLVERLCSAGWQIASARQNARTERDTGAHSVMFDLPGQDGVRRVGQYRATAYLFNSHDCTRRFSLAAGLSVCACDNQLHVTVEGIGETLDHIHLGGDFDLSAAMKLVENKHSNIALTVGRMTSQFLCQEDVWNFGQRALMHVNGHASPLFVRDADVEYAITPRREEDKELTLWNTLNVVQENLIQRGRRGGLHEVLRNHKLNVALWNEATALLN